MTETEHCYKDFPVIIRVNNQSTNAFMTSDMIIKITSKKVTCNNHFENLHLRKEKKVLAKIKNIITLENDDKYTHLKFNLQTRNITAINYRHNPHILNSVNIVSKADISVVEETNGVFHVSEDRYSEIYKKIESFKESNLSQTNGIVTDLLLKFASSTIGIIVIAIIIARAVYLYMN